MTRRMRRLVMALGVTLGPAGAAFAQPSPPPVTTARPAVGPEKPFVPPARVERSLPNGMRVVAVRYATVPKVSVVLTLRSGLANDPPDKAGLAEFVADAAQEGTTSRDSVALRREVFAMGASLGASVGQDATSFSMRGLAETLPRMLDVLADVVQRPTFPASEVELLTSTAAQQLQAQLASPQYVANRTFRHALFGDQHPYARTGATPETVTRIDRPAIAAFHQQHYVPSNAFVVVSGDVAPEAVFAAVEKAFAAWKGGQAPDVKAPPVAALQGRTLVFVQRPNSVQSSISVGNFTVARADPRWLTVQAANQIYGAAFDSRLVRNIREQKGYTYSPQSQFGAFEQAGFYRAVADVRNDVTGATLKEIFAEMDALKETGPTPPELESTKTYMRGLFVIQNATQAGLANTLSTMYTFGLGSDYPETFQKRVSGLNVEAVKTGASMLLGGSNAVVVVVGDYAVVKDQLTGFSDIRFVDLAGKPIPEPR